MRAAEMHGTLTHGTLMILAARDPKRSLPWLGLALLLACYWLYASSLWSIDAFGRSHDDTIYFSSARALAEGKGYTLPSLPGNPAQTKYPVLYPWLLSWVWKLHPSFPANVVDALRLTSLFGCLFLVAAFVYLRRQAGNTAATVITGLCAFHPVFGRQSTNLYSDVPFMALALAACIAADAALEPTERPLLLWATAALAGLAVLTRTLGVAVVAGVVICALQRRLWRRAAVFCLAVSPFLLGWALWVSAHQGRAAAGSSAGWRQTLSYYTSYGEFWRLSVPNTEVLKTLLTVNFSDIVNTPGALCLFPPPGWPDSYVSLVACACFAVWIGAGIRRQVRERGWGPLHFALLVTSGIILFWNYAIAQSYLMLFLPLFYLGLWRELRHVLGMLRGAWRPGRPRSERVVAGALGVVLAAGAVTAARHYAVGFRPAYRLWDAERAALAGDQEEAYAWIRLHTAPDDRLVAYEDANLYLHTGRQAMWLLAFTNGAFYSKDVRFMDREIAMMPDVARHICARYWLFVEGDFYRENGSRRIRERVAEWRKRLPVVYRTSHQQAEIYDLSCVLDPGQEACRSIAAALKLDGAETRAASDHRPGSTF